MKKIGKLISFSKINNLIGTNVGKDLIYVTTCSCLNMFVFQDLEGGLIFALFHYHSVAQKQPMIHTARHEEDRKLNELFKNI